MYVKKFAAVEEKLLKRLTKKIISGDKLSDTLINTSGAGKKFGNESKNLPLVQKNRTPDSIFLLKFDADRKKLSGGKKIFKVELSFKIWDPDNTHDTIFKIVPVYTKWEEKEATWESSGTKAKWLFPNGFSIGMDTAPLECAEATIIVRCNKNADTVTPGVEYKVDITNLVRQWQMKKIPNNGIALIPIHHEEMNQGHNSRNQICAKEHKTDGPQIIVYHSK